MITDEKGRPLTYWGGLDKSKKQTAVEWLEEQINLGFYEIGLIDAIQKAKEMEKEQREQDFINGYKERKN
jgi:hypothetical protein